MNISATFLLTNLMLGFGLAMDAFSVSLANGLHDSNMRLKKAVSISATFALFQALMPMIGWVCVHTIARIFIQFQKIIPCIALFLLVVIGIGLIKDSFLNEVEASDLDAKALVLQGIATSIDALSVGFTIADYKFLKALFGAVIIGIITFVVCFAGVKIGKCCGTKLSGKANFAGGIILIVIGIKIFVEGVVF